VSQAADQSHGENPDDHLVDPPIVDFLYFNTARDAYAITFVPQDSVSVRQKEVVEVSRDSGDGKRIALRITQIGDVIGGKVDRIFHAGGGDLGFYLQDGRLYQLSVDSPSSTQTQQLYTLLQDLATVAEAAFCTARTRPARTA
jgi:hypothetical protein